MCRVMVVDDEPLVRDAVAHVVSSEFENIELAASTGSGEKAIELASRERPDIILMDIRLDGRGGLEALKEIKEFLPGAAMVVISAYDNFSYARQAIRLGVLDYLLKPVNKQDIVDIINNARLQAESRSVPPAVKSSADNPEKNEYPTDYDGRIPLEREKELLDYIEMENYFQAAEKLEQICEEVDERFTDEEKCHYSRELLIVIMRQIFTSAGLEKLDFTERFDRSGLLADLEAAECGSKALQVLQEHFRRMLNFLLDEKSDGEEPLERARRYLEENYDESISLDELAAEAGLSPSYLSRSFKQRFGLSFSEYLNRLRLDEARRLLRSSRKNVGEIAREVGFNDSNYFSRVFKQEEGIPPSRYRRRG